MRRSHASLVFSSAFAGLLLVVGVPEVRAQPRPAKAPPLPTVSAPARASPAGAAARHSAGAGGAPQAAPREDEDVTAAAASYKAGAALAKSGKWKEAHPLFVAAWKRLKHWQIAVSLGTVELEIGKYRVAEQHLSFALGASDLPARDRERVIELIARARAEQGTIRIKATAEGEARVWLDDELIGTAPLDASMSADPGEHRVELRFGGQREARVVSVAKGQSREVTLHLVVADVVGEPSSEEATFPLRPVVIGTGAALGAVALGVGIGTLVGSLEKGRELDQKGRFRDNQGIEDNRALLANGSIWSFIGLGLVAAGTTTAVLLLPGPEKKKVGLELRWTGTGATAGVLW